MSVIFNSTGYGVTGGSAADIQALTAFGLAIRIRGDVLKAFGTRSSSDPRRIFTIGGSPSGGFIYMNGVKGSTITKITFQLISQNPALTFTMTDIDVSGLSDTAYYTFWAQRDVSPLGGSSGQEFVLYKDDGTVVGQMTPGSTTAISGPPGLNYGYVAISAGVDGSLPSILAVDGVAIYSRSVPVASRPIATPPLTSATNLIRLWKFDENTGSTATDAKSSAVLSLTGQTWGTDGTWDNSAAPPTATEVRITAQPNATYNVGDIITIPGAATDAGGGVQTNLESGTVKLRARSAPAGWDLTTVLDSDTWVHGQAVLTFQVPMAGTWSFGLDDDSNALTDSTTSSATTVSMPSGSGTLILGDSMDKGMVAAGSVKQRTLRFRALNASGAPVTGLTGKAKFSINSAAAVDSTNALAEVGSGYYTVEVAAGELAAVDDVVQLFPWGTIAYFTGYTAAVVTASDLSVAPDSKAAIATEVAGAVLVAPANKLLTDASGNVTSTNAGTGLTPTQQSQLAQAATATVAIQERTDLIPDAPAAVSDIPTAVENAAAVATAAATTPLPVEVVKIKTVPLGVHAGTAQDPFGP